MDNYNNSGGKGKAKDGWVKRMGLEDLIYEVAKTRRHNKDEAQRADDWVRVLQGLTEEEVGESRRRGSYWGRRRRVSRPRLEEAGTQPARAPMSVTLQAEQAQSRIYHNTEAKSHT